MDKPTAWADDKAIAGYVGNCASATAKEYWERSNWADRQSAERLRHPLYSQAQLDAAVAAEREACAVIAETPVAGEQDDITMEAKDRIAAAIRARPNALGQAGRESD